MVRNLIFTVALACSSIAYAQFHFEFGLSFNSSTGEFGKIYDNGVGLYAEPKFAVSDQLDIGLFVGHHVFSAEGGFVVILDAVEMTQVMMSGLYRFKNEKSTPYVGLDLGVYSFKESGSGEQQQQTKFGLAPSIGMFAGRLNIGAAFNIVQDASYLQLNIGYVLFNRNK